MPMTDAERMLEIDEDNLDQELAEHPNMVARNKRAQREARAALNKAKAAHKLLHSKFLIKVRNHPGKYDLEDNPPMDLVKAAVETQPAVQDAWEAVLDAEETYQTFVDASSILYERRKAMEELTALAAMDFRSEPSTERAARLAAYRDKVKQNTRKGIKPGERRRR